MQIQNTHALALSLARSALSLPEERRPKAYVRLTYSFYEMKSASPSSSTGGGSGHAEGSEAMRPDGARGRWWHETLRGLAQLRDGPVGDGAVKGNGALNVGAVQAAAWYGPGSWGGEVAPRVVVGHVYQYLYVAVVLAVFGLELLNLFADSCSKEDMKFLYKCVATDPLGLTPY